MAKKDINYFETFNAMAQAAVRASEALHEMLSNYNNVSEKANRIHDIEHEADKLFHNMMGELNRAFITPIDREDILLVADKIDSIIDGIEDVANLFDMLSVTSVRPEMLQMSELLIKCCKCLSEQIDEFRSFKHFTKLNDLCKKVNNIEEEGDRLHRSIIKNLYNSKIDVLEIIKWKEIYDTMELAFDLCEDVADLISGLTIKNG